MAVTVRLSPETERVLRALAKRRGQTRSDVVREAIEQFGSTTPPERATPRPIDAWADVIGIVDSGAATRQGTTGEQFAALVRRKARARRSR